MARDHRSQRGIIVAHYGIAVAVRFDDGSQRPVDVRRNSGHVVGDQVEIGDRGLISLPARGVLSRRDKYGRIHSIASNLDVLGVVLAVRPQSPLGFLDRAIVSARAADIDPILIVNKADLAESKQLYDQIASNYASSGRAFLVGAHRGEGLDALREYFAAGYRGVFIGSSGVGKSSLLNAICPAVDLQVGELNAASGLGRHVTTTATLHELPAGGELVDTPGFRDFGPVEVSPRDLAQHFPGFEAALETACRFNDCSHRSEPGSSVRDAVEGGTISESRHDAYVQLLAELESAEQDARGY
ncbi:MAG: ribosome small subunit-dependent GTPase A [Myxococcota bacterium]